MAGEETRFVLLESGRLVEGLARARLENMARATMLNVNRMLRLD